MSAPQFTPGPWWVDEAPVGLLIRSALDGDVDGDTGQHVVVGGEIVAQAEDIGQAEANARLIAAAPELYALAEQFERVAEYELRKMQREKAEDDEGIRLRQLNLNLIRDTLRKARGDR